MTLIRASELGEQKLVRSLPHEADVNSTGGRSVLGEVRSRLDSEVDDLRKALAASEEKRDQLVAAARDQGRRDAIAAHKRDEAAYAAMLAKGLEAALTEFRIKVDTLNRSAVLICENALARLVGDAAKYRALISGAVAHQLAQLQSETVIAVRVSPADFPDTASLGAIANESGLPQHVITHDPALDAGACKMELRLGTIDISLPDYWEALQSSFARLKLEAPHA